MFWHTTVTQSMPFNPTSPTFILKSLFGLYIFTFFWCSCCIVPFLVVRLISVLDWLWPPWYHELFLPHLRSWSHPCPWKVVAFASRNDTNKLNGINDVLAKNYYYFLATRRHDTNSECLVNWHSRYCYCRCIFKAWKIVNVFSKCLF